MVPQHFLCIWKNILIHSTNSLIQAHSLLFSLNHCPSCVPPKSRLWNGLLYAECLLGSALGGNFCGMEGRSRSGQREKSRCLHSRGQGICLLLRPLLKEMTAEDCTPRHHSLQLNKSFCRGSHNTCWRPPQWHWDGRMSLELPTDATWELQWNNGVQRP